MKATRMLGVVVLSMFCGQLFAASAETVAANDAKRLAACSLALDASCVVTLSDVDAYQRLAPAKSNFNFVESQTRFYSEMKRAGWQIKRWDVGAPGEPFSTGNRLYVFIPYVSATNYADGKEDHETRSFLVGVSTDEARSWKFVDGRSLTSSNITAVIPGYRGVPELPESVTSDVRP